MSNRKLVMLVDDSRPSRFFFQMAVREVIPDTDFIEAIDGPSAIHQLTSTTRVPDFIFMDINMPCMDGFQCLGELKKIEKTSPIPVCMYSTSNNPNDVALSQKLGAVAYLQKHDDISQLVQEISSFLN